MGLSLEDRNASCSPRQSLIADSMLAEVPLTGLTFDVRRCEFLACGGVHPLTVGIAERGRCRPFVVRLIPGGDESRD